MMFKHLRSHLRNRTFGRLSSAELSDFGCFLIMASGVALLELTGMRCVQILVFLFSFLIDCFAIRLVA